MHQIKSTIRIIVAYVLLLVATLPNLASAANNPPTFTSAVAGASDTLFVNEDYPGLVPGIYSFPDFLTDLSAVEVGQTVTSITTANNNHALFTTQPAFTITRGVGAPDSAKLTFKLAANAFGSATVTVTLKDNGTPAGITTYTFTITVNPRNDAPTIATIANQPAPGQPPILEDSGWHTVALTGITAGPANESANFSAALTTDVPVSHIDDQSVTLSASAFPTGIVENISIDYNPGDTTATLHYKTVDDAFGTTTITVTATDNGAVQEDIEFNTFSRSFRVTVTPVNDPPKFKFGNAPTVMYWLDLDYESFSSKLMAANFTDPTVRSWEMPTTADWVGFQPLALDPISGKLFMYGYVPSLGQPEDFPAAYKLAAIDIKTGEKTIIGPAPDTYINAMTFSSSGVLYGAGSDNTLYTISTTDGTLTPVGPTGLSFVRGLAFDGSGNLWYVGTSGIDPETDFGTLDLTTGAHTSTALLHTSSQTISSSVDGLTYYQGSFYTLNSLTSEYPYPYRVLFHVGADGLVTVQNTGIAYDHMPSAGPIAESTDMVVAVNEDSGKKTVEGFVECLRTGAPNEIQTLSFIVTVPDEKKALFSALPKITLPTPTSTLGTLTFTPAKEAYGEAVVTVTLKDSGGASSAPQTFVIKIGYVDDPPTMNKPANITIYETPNNPNVIPGTASEVSIYPQAYSVTLTGISPGPANESSQKVRYIYASAENHPSIDTEGPIENVAVEYTEGDTTAIIHYDTVVNANGTATINVNLYDDGGDGVGHYSFTVTVKPVNSPPSFDGFDSSSIIVAEDSPEQTYENFITSYSAGPDDESAQKVKFLVTLSPADKLLFATQPTIFIPAPATVAGAGSSDVLGATLKFKPKANAFGTAIVHVKIQDDGGTLNGGFNTSLEQTFEIKITPLNDAPTLMQPVNVSMLEDTPRTITFSGITAGPLNESDQTLTFTVTTRPHSPDVHNPFPETLTTLTYSGGTTATLVLQPNENEFGIADIDITITDNGKSGRYLCDDFKSITRTFRVTVTPVNDPPSFTKGADQVVEQNSATTLTTVPGWATGIKAGPDNELAAPQSQTVTKFVILQNSKPGTTFFKTLPSINPTTGDLKFQIANNAFGTATVTMAPVDSLNKTGAGQSFTITVLPDIFVADVGTLDTPTGKLLRIKALSGTQTVVKTNILNPYSLTMMANRDLLQGRLAFDTTSAAINKIAGATATYSEVSAGNNLVSPVGVSAVSGSDNDNIIVVADAETPAPPPAGVSSTPLSGAVILIDTTTGIQTVLSQGFVNLAGITRHYSLGNIFVTDGGNGSDVPPSVIQIYSDGNRRVVDSGGYMVSPVGIAENPQGGLVVVDAVAKKLISLNSAQEVISCGQYFVHPTHVTVDAIGDFIVTDDAAGSGLEPRVIRVKRDGTQTIITQGGNLVSPKGLVTDPKVVNLND